MRQAAITPFPDHTTTSRPSNRPNTSPSPSNSLRLRVDRSSVGSGALDGAWWPHSRDLVAEAVELVEHFPEWFDRIWRVVYSAPDWDRPTQRRVHASTVLVTLSSFPGADTHLVLLKGVASGRVLQVLVIPPEWSAASAELAMNDAVSARNTRSGKEILDRYRDHALSA